MLQLLPGIRKGFSGVAELWSQRLATKVLFHPCFPLDTHLIFQNSNTRYGNTAMLLSQPSNRRWLLLNLFLQTSLITFLSMKCKKKKEPYSISLQQFRRLKSEWFLEQSQLCPLAWTSPFCILSSSDVQSKFSKPGETCLCVYCRCLHGLTWFITRKAWDRQISANILTSFFKNICNILRVFSSSDAKLFMMKGGINDRLRVSGLVKEFS